MYNSLFIILFAVALAGCGKETVEKVPSKVGQPAEMAQSKAAPAPVTGKFYLVHICHAGDWDYSNLVLDENKRYRSGSFEYDNNNSDAMVGASFGAYMATKPLLRRFHGARMTGLSRATRLPHTRGPNLKAVWPDFVPPELFRLHINGQPGVDDIARPNHEYSLVMSERALAIVKSLGFECGSAKPYTDPDQMF